MTPSLGLLEAFDRTGALLARVPVTHWPMTVGRGLDCDLVLDDPFVAPMHLRIGLPAGSHGMVDVQVLETLNGASLHRKHFAAGERFDWPDGAALEIGRTRVMLRLAGTQIADEQPLPQFPWRMVATTTVLLLLVLAASLALSWLDATDLSKYLKALPGALLGVVLGVGIWAGLWALANKVFAGRLQFWRHVRIACAIYLAGEAVQAVASLTAFAFSWESLSRFGYLLVLVVAACGICAHLAAVLPRRRVGITWAVVAVVALGIPAWLGSQWLDHMRLSSQLYMSSLFPPNVRMVPAVPVPQFLQEAQSLRGRLDRRMRNDDHADGSPDDDDGDDGDGGDD